MHADLVRKYPSQAPSLPLDFDGEPETAPMRTIHVSAASVNTPKEDRPAFIRKYTVSTPDSIHCADGLRRTQKAIQCLTAEFRTLMATIRQRRREDNPSMIRKFPTLLSESTLFGDDILRTQEAVRRQHIEIRTIMKDIDERNQQFRQLDADLVKQLAHQVDLCDARLYDLQKDFKTVLDDMTRRVMATFEDKSTRISTSVLALRTELSQTLDFISKCTHLIHLTNNAAIDIYYLHISLRWCLATMILTRQRCNYPSSQIVPLEEKLVKLRSFQNILFVHKEGLKQRHIREKLDKLESTNVHLRPLRLSVAATRRQKTERLGLSTAELIQRTRNADLRRALHNSSLRAHARIRYTLDKPHIRLTRKSAGPVFRRIVWRKGLVRVFKSERMCVRRFLGMKRKVRGPEVVVGEERARRVVGLSGLERRRVEGKRLVETVSSWLGLGVGDGGSK